MEDDPRLVEVLTVETTVLEELAAELADDMRERSEQILDAVARAGRVDEVVWKIKTLVIFLRPVDIALSESKHQELALAIRGVRRRLAHEVDIYQRRKYAPRVPKRFSSGEWKPPES